MYNPVKLHFGKGVVEKTGKSASEYGKKALLVYGRGSVKHNGAYDDTAGSLNEAGIEIVEYTGIRPNPVVEDADRAADLGRRENVDMIVAVGGGSVIDCAKVISVAVPCQRPAWELVEGAVKPLSGIPLLAVLTLAATGTEMNANAVIQNNKLMKKVGFKNNLMFPKHSFLDSSYTLTVPANYTAYGIVDLVAHALEAFFGNGDSTLTDKFTLNIIDEAFEYGPKLMNDLKNHELREKIMFAATCALNGMTAWGRKGHDWGVHAIGHVLSVIYDIPHGASLSIAYPAWFKLFKDRIPKRIGQLGKGLFNHANPDIVIDRFEKYFSGMDAPVKLSQLGVDISAKDVKEKVTDVMVKNKVSGFNYEIDQDDYMLLLEMME